MLFEQSLYLLVSLAGFLGAALLGAAVCFAGRKSMTRKTDELDALR